MSKFRSNSQRSIFRGLSGCTYILTGYLNISWSVFLRSLYMASGWWKKDAQFSKDKLSLIKQNRSTEGCSKLKRSVDMTNSGKNGLNIRTNASPKWDRTRCPGGVSVLFLLAAPVAMFYGNLQNLVIKSKSVIKSSSVISSQIGVMSNQLSVSLYMVMSQNVM